MGGMPASTAIYSIIAFLPMFYNFIAFRLLSSLLILAISIAN